MKKRVARGGKVYWVDTQSVPRTGDTVTIKWPGYCLSGVDLSWYVGTVVLDFVNYSRVLVEFGLKGAYWVPNEALYVLVNGREDKEMVVSKNESKDKGRSVVIQMERVWVGMQKMLEVTRVEARRKEDLPKEYLEGAPACWIENLGGGDILVVKLNSLPLVIVPFPVGQRELHLFEGRVLTPTVAAEVVSSCEAAGTRLAEINRARKMEEERRREWSGTILNVI